MPVTVVYDLFVGLNVKGWAHTLFEVHCMQ